MVLCFENSLEKAWRTIEVKFSLQCFRIAGVKKSFSTWKTIWFMFTHFLYFFFPQSNDVLTVTRWDKRDDNSHFLREESERLFENSESLTRGKCCFFCCRLKIFFKCWAFFTQKNKLQYKTHLCFSPLFVFSNGSIFCRLEKPWRTIAVLFSSQFFPIPRVVVKKSFSTRKTIWFLYCLLTFCISFFYSPTMCCL